jgi:hypothetical protein
MEPHAIEASKKTIIILLTANDLAGYITLSADLSDQLAGALKMQLKRLGPAPSQKLTGGQSFSRLHQPMPRAARRERRTMCGGKSWLD